MDRDLYAARLAASAEAAWAFAGSMASEDLPARLVFRVRLNQSYDGLAPLPGEVGFPADSAADRAAAPPRCTDATRRPSWRSCGAMAVFPSGRDRHPLTALTW